MSSDDALAVPGSGAERGDRAVPVTGSAESDRSLPGAAVDSLPDEEGRCWKASSFGEDFCGVHRTRDWPCPFDSTSAAPAAPGSDTEDREGQP